VLAHYQPVKRKQQHGAEYGHNESGRSAIGVQAHGSSQHARKKRTCDAEEYGNDKSPWVASGHEKFRYRPNNQADQKHYNPVHIASLWSCFQEPGLRLNVAKAQKAQILSTPKCLESNTW
jgi:hypothetical protein